MIARILADLILALHVAIIVFNIGSLFVVWIGAAFGWRWVRNPWFRWTHVGLLGIVAIQAILGLMCPLTVWENMLRIHAGQGEAYTESFIVTWTHRLFFYDFPAWVFVAAYLLFFLLVFGTLWLVPPRKRERLSK